MKNNVVHREYSCHFLTSQWQWCTSRKVCTTQTKPLFPRLVDHFRGKKGKRRRISNAVRCTLQGLATKIKWKIDPIDPSHTWALSTLCVVLNQIVSSESLSSFWLYWNTQIFEYWPAQRWFVAPKSQGKSVDHDLTLIQSESWSISKNKASESFLWPWPSCSTAAF